MNSVVNPDFLLPVDMRVVSGISYGKETGELIFFRSTDNPFDVFGFIADRNPESA